jgi:xanthine dehydrogenase small subunit
VPLHRLPTDPRRRPLGRRHLPEDRFSEQLERPGESIAFTRESAGRIYATPTDFAALWAHLAAHPQARLICGGTDLSLLITKRFIDLPELVSLEGLRELRGVTKLERGWRSVPPPTSPSSRPPASPSWPPTPRCCACCGTSPRARSRTARRSAATCATPRRSATSRRCCSASAPRAVLRSASGTRRVPLDEFFLAYRQTALQPG